MTDYSEILLQSVQTLIDKSLESISSDRTVVCTITDNTNRLAGQYKVSSNNNITYTVYSDKDTYKIGEQVVVLLPQDDTQNKMILSKYVVADTQKPIVYVSPKEQFIETTDNLMPSLSGSIMANGETEIVEIGTILSSQLQNSKFYNTIYLSADFACLLSTYDIRSGNYGLLIEGYTSFAEDSAPVVIMQLDSKQMFGNPYAFMTPFSQEILFHYNIDNDFKKLKVYLYQSNDFTYFDGINVKRLPELPSTSAILASTPSNIVVNNINLRFGYDVTSVIDNTVKIVCMDSLDYSKAIGLHKEIELIWYNKNEENKFLGFSDGIFSQDAKKKIGVIHTKKTSAQSGFLYTLKDSSYKIYYSDQEYSEGDAVFYRDGSSLATTKDNVILGPAASADTCYYWIEWLIDDINGTLSITTEGSIEKYNALCRLDLATTKVQANVWCNGEIYSSNIITFQNQDINSNNIYNLGIEMSFDHIEPGYPVYALYKKNNKLMHQKDSSTRRKIKAKCIPRATEVADSFWAGATITWGIPKNATMLKPDPSLKDKENIKTYETDSYFYYEFDYSPDNLIFTYLIKEEYNQNYQNNTITCSVALPGNRGTVYGSEQIAFSSLGSNGTDYTFTINTTKGGFPWNSLNTTRINFNASLRDANNTEIETQNLKYYRVWPNVSAVSSIQQNANDINRYNLMRATCTANWNGNSGVEFETYLPIIYSKDEKYYAEAPSEIVYNSFGTKESGGEAIRLKLRDTVTNEEIEKVQWRLMYQRAAGKRTESNAVAFDALNNNGSNWVADWVPKIGSEQRLIGKVLENQYVGFIGTSTEQHSIGEQANVLVDMIQEKVLVENDSNSSTFPAKILSEQNHLYKWTTALFSDLYEPIEHFYTNEPSAPKDEPRTLTIYTTKIKDQETWYTIFNEEVFNTDIYEIVKQHGKDSRWSPKAIKHLDEYLQSSNYVEFKVGEVNNYDGTWKFTDTQAVIKRAEGVEFTPGRYGKYITYKDIEKNIYYFLAPVLSDLKLQSGQYYRIIGSEITSEVSEYRYLLSVKLSGRNIPEKETYILFHTPVLDQESEVYKGSYANKAPIDSLSLGVYTTYTISTPEMYMDTGYYSILQALQTQANGNDVVLWSQPLPVLQYKYGSELLNKWNGQLKIDEGNNYILSAMLGAGVKNDDNTFSGVIMGDTKVLDDNNRATHAIGLYGYHEGAQSFGFKVDGKAFLGKSGRGRIEFDGNTGKIKSTDENGMTIDLDDGIISAGRFTLDTNFSPPEETTINITLGEKDNTVNGGFIFDTNTYELTFDSNIKVANSNNEEYKITKQLTVGDKRLAVFASEPIQAKAGDIYVLSGQIKAPGSRTHRFIIKQNDRIVSSVNISNTGSTFKNFTVTSVAIGETGDIQVGIAGYPFSSAYSDQTMQNSFACKDLKLIKQTPKTSTRILLNNVDSDKDIMYIGTPDNNISLNQNGQLAINVNQFALSAGDWDSGIVIFDNSATGTDYNFAIGKFQTTGDKIVDYIRYSADGGVEIASKKFALNAGDWSSGYIKIDSKASDNYYLAVGKKFEGSGSVNDNYLTVGKSGVEIKTPNFWLKQDGSLQMSGSLEAGSSANGWKDGYVGINTSNYYLAVGNNTTYFKFDKKGNLNMNLGGLTYDGKTLKVPAANIDGTVTAGAINLDTATITGTLDVTHMDVGSLVSQNGTFTGTLNAVSGTFTKLSTKDATGQIRFGDSISLQYGTGGLLLVEPDNTASFKAFSCGNITCGSVTGTKALFTGDACFTGYKKDGYGEYYHKLIFLDNGYVTWAEVHA